MLKQQNLFLTNEVEAAMEKEQAASKRRAEIRKQEALDAAQQKVTIIGKGILSLLEKSSTIKED